MLTLKSRRFLRAAENAAAISAAAPTKATTMNPTNNVMTTRDDWYIEADWTDPTSGETRVFCSDRLDQWDAERYPVGSPITVLIDPQYPESYYVEIAR
jgi:hypothetical protein